jgi:hypothetical protein
MTLVACMSHSAEEVEDTDVDADDDDGDDDEDDAAVKGLPEIELKWLC